MKYTYFIAFSVGRQVGNIVIEADGKIKTEIDLKRVTDALYEKAMTPDKIIITNFILMNEENE